MNKGYELCGLTYRKYLQTIFICGGTDTYSTHLNHSQYLDITKNEFYSLPNLTFNHYAYPSVWIHETDNNFIICLLYNE